MDIHDLTAAYALDALEPDEAEAYEAHLGQCEECRMQLAELSESAGALAFGAVAPPPPPRLRAAILDAAAAERSNVIPLVRRRWMPRVLAVAAAAAACIAVGFTVSALKSNGSPGISTTLVSIGGSATLSVKGLPAAPADKTYEAWVIAPGGRARPAGLFPGGAYGSVVHLAGNLRSPDVVAVTLEPAGGSPAPTTTPLVSART